MKLEDIKFLKATDKDYDTYGYLIGEAVENFPEWQAWMQKYWGRGVSREMFYKGHNIVGDNLFKFKKHFGKCAFHFKSEFYFYGWLVDLGGTQVIVLTAKGKGTCYEMVIQDKESLKVKGDINKVLEFMDMIAELK